MKIDELYSLFKSCSGFTTDTRLIKSGDFFIALRGEHFDANTFTKQALEAGAAYVLVDRQEFVLNKQCLLVNNTLHTLQELASFHRQQFTIPVIAIGGSNGKTTTKELTQVVLSSTFKVHCTKGNLNNHIGVPLTLLAMPIDTEIAVIEIGANHLQETADLCKIVAPNFGIITNNGKDHLEGFGNLENVKKANAELFDYLKSANGFAFVNGQDQDLIAAANGLTTSIYNTEISLVSGKVIDSFPLLICEMKIADEKVHIKSDLAGDFNLVNIMAAVGIGHYFKVAIPQIKFAVENYHPINNRSQWVKWNRNEVLMDCYNANPSSMLSAITSFKNIPSKNKIVILGDMFELGDYSLEEHSILYEQLINADFAEIVLIGEEWGKVKNKTIGSWFSTTVEAKQWLVNQQFQDCFLLVKGSRGMALENLFK